MKTDTEIAAEKALLRHQVLRELSDMTPDDRAARSEKICQRVLALPEWEKAQRVLLFSPMRTEPDIAELETRADEAGKIATVIPFTQRNEPGLEISVVPDLIFVPGLAFSRDRHRMGRGGGFYDRLLAGRARDAFKLGVCFATQLHDAIPHEAHDIPVDAVISD